MFRLMVQFLKKTMGVEEDDPQASLKTELKQLFTKLVGKLDALCNFHYTPKIVIPEMKVILFFFRGCNVYNMSINRRAAPECKGCCKVFQYILPC